MLQREISLSDIEFGERFRKDYGNITELITSIQKEGLIQPLAVYAQSGKEQPYLLLAGGRRFTACTKAKIEKVPCIIFDTPMSELDVRTIELAENLYRKNLEWHEQVRLEAEIHRLQIDKFGKGTAPGTLGAEAVGWTKKKTADMLGVDAGKITKDLMLADMLEKIPTLKTQCKNADDARKLIMNAATKLHKSSLAEAVAKRQAETPIDIQRKQLVNRFILGDFVEMVKNVPDGSVDIIEMDPPYAIDLNNAKKSENNMNLQMGEYHEIPKDRYLHEIDRFLNECYRIMSKDSWLLVWFGPEPWFEDIYTLIRRHNFDCLRMPCIWVKEDFSGQSKRPSLYLPNSYEMFFYARKGNAIIQKPGRSNVFIYKPVVSKYKEHPTEKPIELYMDILSCFALPGQKLIVPFLGSGNTLLAAENIGIIGMGYEKAAERKDGFTLKVYDGTPGNYRSYQ